MTRPEEQIEVLSDLTPDEVAKALAYVAELKARCAKDNAITCGGPNTAD